MEQENSNQADQAASVLQRKTSVGKAEHQARAMSLPKALRISMAKVADDLCEMALAVIGVRRQTCKLSELPDVFDPKHLLVLLDGTLRRRAAAVFDPVFVGGLIQQETMAKVMPVLDEETRQLTATDAAICAPFLDELLKRAAALPEEEAQRDLIAGYRFGAYCEEPRLLMMALEEPEYELFHLTVDMAGGQRQGLMTLCFPTTRVEALSVQEDQTSPDAPDSGRPGRGGIQIPQTSLMERTVMALNVDLNIALARIRMTVSTLQALKVDDVLDLDVNSFDTCTVQTREGRRLSRGKLGQIDGVRALQLEHEAPRFNAPRRRGADRPDLDLPVVSGDGTGTQARSRGSALKQLPQAVPATLDDMGADMPHMVEIPALGDLPEVGDLPQMPVLAKVPDLPEGESLSGQPDMPDLSDLPDFNNDDGPMTIT